MQLWRRGLDRDGLRRAARRRRFGLSLLLHGVVVRHATIGHLGLTLGQIQRHTVVSEEPERIITLGVTFTDTLEQKCAHLRTRVHGGVREGHDSWWREERRRKQLLRLPRRQRNRRASVEGGVGDRGS